MFPKHAQLRGSGSKWVPDAPDHTERAASLAAPRRVAALCLSRMVTTYVLTDPEIAAQQVITTEAAS